jgi:hypothetical protein
VLELESAVKCTCMHGVSGVCVLGLPNGNIATGSTGKQDSGKVVDFQVITTVTN